MADKQLWIWNWVGGGYNSCQAVSREDALAQGTELGRAKFAGYVTLVVDEKTLRQGTYNELAGLDRQYASLFY